MRHKVLGPAAAFLVAAGVLAVPAHPVAAASAAAAAVCPGATGVTVVVDYNDVGGPTRAGCDPNGGGDSVSQVFPDAGFSLEYHPRQPGFVCKVTGLPDDRPCLENDSFWSLWWSDGSSGEWRFANQGVGGLTVPDGGYVAFSWHQGAGQADPPDYAPTPRQTPVEPSDNNGGSGDGDGGDDGDDGDGSQEDGATSEVPSTGATTASTAASASDATSGAGMPDDRKKSREADATTDPTSDSSTSTVPGAAEITAGPPPSGDLVTESDEEGGGALPTWIGLLLAVLVLGVAGSVAVLRRRSG